MNPISITPIVEGHGEVEAVPVLLRRLSNSIEPGLHIFVNPPIRVKFDSFTRNEEYFSKYIQLATAKAVLRNGFVLILLDCDDDCPAKLGPALLKRARTIRSDVPFLIVLAYREYESWFVAAARSLLQIDPPPEPEKVRGAKEWLSRNMPYPYDPVIHQEIFTRQFDLEAAGTLPSFQRFRRRLAENLKPATK